ncbi:MAG: LacI family DNA-binding transcriptional regulator [Balneolaceae bacterium]|nr:LacI family DNA-binding transcriptional regulator [Balneolaceae bacterium]
MKKKKTTIIDIARELDVTASTVSRALSNHPRISNATKQAVREMAEKLDYQPNNIAAALRKGKSNIIGALVPTADRSFFASVIRGIEEVVSNQGYNLIICQSNDQSEKEKQNLEALLKIQVDGIIASVAKETTKYEHFEKIIEQEIPLILYDRVSESLDVNAVVSDDYRGSCTAVSHLIEQGCRSIVHFAGEQHMNIYRNRLTGFRDALQDHGLTPDDSLIFEEDLIQPMEQVLDVGRQFARTILEMPKRPDGIFSASDFAALGAMQVLKEHGIKIPDDIAVVGYSNDVSGSFIEPGLSTVDQHTKRMGNLAARLFLEQADGKDPQFTPRKTMLKPKLIVRGSSNRGS